MATRKDFNPPSRAHSSSAGIRRRLGAGFTVVIPFFNEARYIEATLQSIADQSLRPERMILVDNGSTDRSAEICLRFAGSCHSFPIDVVEECKPGKIHALEKASREISTEYVAFCDADTIYPSHYLKLASELFIANADAAAIIAVGLQAAPMTAEGKIARWKCAIIGRILAKQCHSGGFGQCFRVEELSAAGGFDAARWPFVLEDHEIMQRLLKQGKSVYHPDLWCRPSARRKDRNHVSWTLFEQLLYHITPYYLKDWYFYKFLARRFENRGLLNTRLREQPWS